MAIARGGAEMAIVAVLADGPLHGYEIARRIVEESRGVLRFTLASLYPILYRLEARGWLESRWETAESGRKRRSYRLTSVGAKGLKSLRREWRTFFDGLDRLARVRRVRAHR